MKHLNRMIPALVLAASILPAASLAEGLTDGTYTGTGAGKVGDITCEVTVQDGKIASVTVKDHQETAGVCDPAIEKIPQEIVEAQSADVEAVAGATVTSQGIMAAVADCVKQAGGSAEAPAGPIGGRVNQGVYEVSGQEETYTGEDYIRSMQKHGEELVEKNGPKITTLANGVQIQRTPSEYDSGVYSQPYLTMAYNNMFLDADNRGCGACHEDLAATLRDMDGYVHCDLTNDMGLVLDVNDCIDCHSYSPGYVKEEYSAGTLIHGIHYKTGSNFTGNCYSCHAATNDGKGLVLWDNEKYNLMRGIYDTTPDDVSAKFSYDQDIYTERDKFFNYMWLYYANDFVRYGAYASGNNEGDPDVFNSWNITINGLVNEEKTWTLAELIEQAPSVTKMSTMQCTINPTGGPYFANVEITGIPMSWLIEQAGGAKPEAAGYLPYGSDEFATGGSWEKYLENDAYLVYKINGEYLRISDGFPVTFWPVAGSAGLMTKQLSTITLVSAEELADWHVYQGWLTPEGWETGKSYYNKPNLGIFKNNESGKIIKPGETLSLSGYAAAYDEKITGIEISLDRGATWTRYDTPVDNYNVVQWHYDMTFGTVGAYVVSVRAVEGDGLVTPTPQTFLVNVKE